MPLLVASLLVSITVLEVSGALSYRHFSWLVGETDNCPAIPGKGSQNLQHIQVFSDTLSTSLKKQPIVISEMCS